MLEAPLFLLGMPRSGTTWLSQIFEAHPGFVVRLSPNYSYPLKQRLTTSSARAEWEAVLAAAVASDDPFLTQNWQRDAGNLPRFSSTRPHRLAVKDTRFHDVYMAGMDRLEHARCIYLVRNPLAALDSWRRSPEFPPGGSFATQWRSGGCRKHGPGEYWGFDDWAALTRSYLGRARNDRRYLVVRYEALLDEPRAIVPQLFAHVGADVPSPVWQFLQASHAWHSADPYSVFKDPARCRDGWRSGFDPQIASEVEHAVRDTELAEFLA